MGMNIMNSKLARLVVSVVCFVSIVSLSRSIYNLWKRRDFIKGRQEALTKEQALHDKLINKLYEVESPTHIEKTAREKLGYVREGETVVIMPNPTNSMTSDTPQTIDEKDVRIQNWKKWWRLFF